MVAFLSAVCYDKPCAIICIRLNGVPSDDIYRTNTADEPDGVTLQPLSAALDEGRMTVSLPPVTWASVRFTA